MTESDKDARIAMLEQMLREQWAIYADSSLNPEQRMRAFFAFDRRLRKAGVLPKV